MRGGGSLKKKKKRDLSSLRIPEDPSERGSFFKEAGPRVPIQTTHEALSRRRGRPEKGGSQHHGGVGWKTFSPGGEKRRSLERTYI